MTQPAALVLWSGSIDNQTYRVVDLGPGASPRLVVEQEMGADALGDHGWGRTDPVPLRVFEGILLQSGVVS